MRHVSALVEAVQRGDMQAFGELVSRFQDMAYGYAYSVLGDFSLAQDTAQDAFVEAYRSLHTLKDPAAFPGWFKRIVRYRCSRSIRSARKRQVPLDENDIPSGEPWPDSAAERARVCQRVLDAVRKLSAPLREVTTLYYMNGYSQQEVSEFLEVPVGTVKSRLNASRAQLKERLGDMVREALDEHKLPDDFTGRIVEGVPHLAWDRSGNTSYIAAVEAALAPDRRRPLRPVHAAHTLRCPGAPAAAPGPAVFAWLPATPAAPPAVAVGVLARAEVCRPGSVPWQP